jgi:S1-C subfamily serine protease
VASVDPGGPAASAGLRVGDQIVSFDGASLAGLGASFVWRILLSTSAGQTVQIGLACGVTIAVTAVAR